jgi:hypothetical protein
MGALTSRNDDHHNSSVASNEAPAIMLLFSVMAGR